MLLSFLDIRRGLSTDRFWLGLFLFGWMLVFSPLSMQGQKKEIDERELEVLRKIIQNDTVPTVYFKTTISEMNQPLSRHLFYLSDFDLCSTLEQPDSAKLDKEERDYIVERCSTMEVTNINKVVKTPKNYTVKKFEGHNWFIISMPVVFREG